MGATVLNMSMSLDGFVAGPHEDFGNGLGDDGMRLHSWIEFDGDLVHGAHNWSGVNGQVMDELMATGSVLTGRRTMELADNWDWDHHDGVQIFIYSKREPDPEAAGHANVHYVTDIVEGATRAKEAAGDRDVLVHGIRTARDALAAGVLDELELHLVPVLLGQGRRLFEERDAAHIELDLVRALQGEEGVTHLRYRVVK